jgi:hypothetical protein
MEVSRDGSRGISLASSSDNTGDTVTVAAFDPAVFDAGLIRDPSSSDRELSDLEATQEIPVTFRPAPPAATRRLPAAPTRPPTAVVSPEAPQKKGVLSGFLILAIGVALTAWLWVTWTH